MNFYEYIFDRIKDLIERDISPKSMEELFTKRNDMIRTITSNIIFLDSVISAINIARVTKISEHESLFRHIHVIICELDDDAINTLNLQENERMISISSTYYEDEVYTILYTERLNNKSRITYDFITSIYNVLTNEFKNHIQSVSSEYVVPAQDFARSTYAYSQVYIPAWICHLYDCDEKALSNPSIRQFIAYMNSTNETIGSLFDRCGINDAREEGFENILFLDDILLNNEEEDDINNEYDD